MDDRFFPADSAFMAHALRLGRRGLGNTAPNPSVGCVIVKEGHIIGRGWTGKGGRPHAETEALKQAGNQARQATVYVSLEPCAHHGQTGPCAEALVEAGVKRVVVACLDENPKTRGLGIALMRRKGLEVDCGLLQEKAVRDHRGFFLTQQKKRPLVTLKLAHSLDGRTALENGESQWITGSLAREHGHSLRAHYDGILVGLKTALADDPMLDCRLKGMEDRSPIRIILDDDCALPLKNKLVQSAKNIPTWLITTKSLAKEAEKRAVLLQEQGVRLISLEDSRDIKQVLQAMASCGITRLLVEGGAVTHGVFLKADCVDQIIQYQSGLILGGNSQGLFAGVGFEKLKQAPVFKNIETGNLGPDIYHIYERINETERP